MSREEEIRHGLYDNTVEGNSKVVKALTEEAIALGMQPLDLLFGALIPGLEEVGRRFEIGEYFVPEMLISAKAMHEALKLLRPLLAQTGAKPIGRVLMATVKGDMHDIGKNLCIMMLEGAGFEVLDLGVNTPIVKIVDTVREYKPQIVGFSAFLTTTMPMFKANLDALRQAGLRDQVKVIVGGAPVTQEYANRVGADGYGATASATVRLSKELMVSMGYDISGGQEANPDAIAAAQALDALMSKIGEAEAALPPADSD